MNRVLPPSAHWQSEGHPQGGYATQVCDSSAFWPLCSSTSLQAACQRTRAIMLTAMAQFREPTRLPFFRQNVALHDKCEEIVSFSLLLAERMC
jgi:hypothetical protein